MYSTVANNEYIKINYHSDKYVVDHTNAQADLFQGLRVHHVDVLGGYCYPVLEWILDMIGSGSFQILKCARPQQMFEYDALKSVLRDPNTLYSYPDGNKITIVQFSDYDSTVTNLSHFGIDLICNPKMFKRLKTLNRPFRSYYSTDDSVKIVLVSDQNFTSYQDFISPEDEEKLLDGAFIISPAIVNACMAPFDTNTVSFDSEYAFACDGFNRSVEVGNYYRKSKIFNARIFGPIDILNMEGQHNFGAIKGQAFVDSSGYCEKYGVDVIAPYSAFKPEVNFSTRTFFLIEPQPAKLGQMFSDGQTIANIPALYDWHHMRDWLKMYYDQSFADLCNDQVLDQFSSMDFASFSPDSKKMFDETDVKSLNSWNVRAWLACGGKLTHSPWLFEQMGRNLADSMRPTDDRKMRFPIPCSVRALVITESLMRAITGLTEDSYAIELGTARWDVALSVLVVNDLDWIEMYPSHGGCDLDDFFMISWRMINGEKKIVIARSPNDWGEYSIFNYVEGDWHKKTKYGTRVIEFPKTLSDPDLWPERLSEVLERGEVTYTGLPEAEPFSDLDHYCPEYVMAAIKASSDSAASVGINVNARQLWSTSAKTHRPKQLCSMEDCIDAGVQGGTDEQVQAVIQDGQNILDTLIENDISIDAYLWYTKHAAYNPGLDPKLHQGTFTYLEGIRKKYAKDFRDQYMEYAQSIVSNHDFSQIHELGRLMLPQALASLNKWRRSIAISNRSTGSIDPVSWEAINDQLFYDVKSNASGHERSSFMISLYSACLKIPTSSGKYTDQLVMQPLLFGELLESLQFYGVLARLVIDDENSVTRTYDGPWDIRTGNVIHTFENPVHFQNFYFNNKKKALEADA